MKYKVGDKFKIVGQHGSYGVITHVREDGPFKDRPCYYGTFYYGHDVRGEDVTATTGLLRTEETEPVSEEAFAAKCASKFNENG